MTLAIPCTHTAAASLYHCDYATLAAAMREAGTVADAVIVDAPYSERTHAGHDGGNAQAGDRSQRREIDYTAWNGGDVSTFVRAFAPVTRGWICSLTDHFLAEAWASALLDAGRYTFYLDLPGYSPIKREVVGKVHIWCLILLTLKPVCMA